MKNLARSAVLTLFLLIGPSLAMADGWYIGAKTGLVQTDASGYDDATNAGFVLGRDILGVVAGDISLEGEYTTTIDDGSGPGSQEWDVDMLGGYAVFRTAGPAYLKAKGGMVYSDLTVGDASDSSTDTSAGVGLGLSLGLVQLELEYTRINADADDFDYISLTLNLF